MRFVCVGISLNYGNLRRELYFWLNSATRILKAALACAYISIVLHVWGLFNAVSPIVQIYWSDWKRSENFRHTSYIYLLLFLLPSTKQVRVTKCDECESPYNKSSTKRQPMNKCISVRAKKKKLSHQLNGSQLTLIAKELQNNFIYLSKHFRVAVTTFFTLVIGMASN